MRLLFAWGVFIPLSYVLAFPLGGGVRGAWAGAMVYLASLAAVYLLRFRSGRWKGLSVQPEEKPLPVGG